MLVENHGQLKGRFLFSASPNSKVSRSDLLVAIALVDQVGAALA
jgi:hypothetical protein